MFRPSERFHPSPGRAILDLLDEPRTAAELTAALGRRTTVTHVLNLMLHSGHIVHCGKYYYLRAELDGMFEARPRPKTERPVRPETAATKVAILAHMDQPRTVNEIAEILREPVLRVRRMMGAMLKAGELTAIWMEGNARSRVFSWIEPKRDRK